MNISDLLGAVLQSGGLSASSGKRLQNAMGGGLLDSLAGMLGPKGAGTGDMLRNALDSAGKAVGGKQNLAIGGLGALAGALLGGGGKSIGGGIGGGVVALLGAMAFQALKGAGQAQPAAQPPMPPPFTEPQEMEAQAELILRAMINAVKSDGLVDPDEIQKLTGKLRDIGADEEAQRWVAAKLREPMETEALLSTARQHPQLAAQIYAASLMAVEVDTDAEKAYLAQLAASLGLEAPVVERIQSMVGLKA